MTKIIKPILFGILFWIILSLVIFIFLPYKQKDPVYFGIIFTILLSAVIVFMGNYYFKNEKLNYINCLSVGLLWTFICISLDLIGYKFGLLKSSFSIYMADTGFVYVIIPILFSIYPYRRKNNCEI